VHSDDKTSKAKKRGKRDVEALRSNINHVSHRAIARCGLRFDDSPATFALLHFDSHVKAATLTAHTEREVRFAGAVAEGGSEAFERGNAAGL
jgi:hypothetical protein